jgi:hypothetical protein
VQRHGQEHRPQDDLQRRYVRRRDTDDGMVKIIAVLHPEEAELVWRMLDHAAKQASREPAAAAEARRESGGVGAPSQPTQIADSAVSAEWAGPCRSEVGVQAARDSAESRGRAEPSRSVGEVGRGASGDSAESRGRAEPSRSVGESASVPARAELAEGERSVLDQLIDDIEAAELARAAQKEAAAARAERTSVAGVEVVPVEADTTVPGEASCTQRGYGDAIHRDIAPPGRDVAQARAWAAPSALRQRVDAERRAFDRADGLLAVAQAYLRGDRPQRAPLDVTITIPASSLCEGSADTVDVGCVGDACVSAETARRLSCDAGVIEVIEDDQGVPLSVARKRRTIAGSIKRALLRRDTSCAYPGCANRTFLEGHHIKHWADGGETALDNGVLLCSYHHRFVHEYGYRVELDADRRPRFRDPRGTIVVAVPIRPERADLGWPRIHAMNEALRIDAGTIACEWDGSRADYGRLVDELVVVDYAAQPPAMPAR